MSQAIPSPPPGATPLAPLMPPDAAHAARRRSNSTFLKVVDGLTQGTATGGALLMVGLLLLLFAVVGYGAWPAIQKFGWAFLWNDRWSVSKQNFGAYPLIYGTLVTAGIALVISFPVSLGCAIFLTKLAPKLRIPIPRMESGTGGEGSGGFIWVSPRYVVMVASFLIELLAAIPSIAYGLWGVFILAPFMQETLQPAMAATLGQLPWIGQYFVDTGMGRNLFTAGLILSIMVTPIMTAVMRDVLAAAPPELEQGALGLGATWWQATRLVLGFSAVGLFGAVILGFARAIGETMAVTMVVGNSMDLEKTITSPGYTIASLLANQFNNADSDGEIQALIYAAFVLLVITTLINGLARVMVMRVTTRGQRK